MAFRYFERGACEQSVMQEDDLFYLKAFYRLISYLLMRRAFLLRREQYIRRDGKSVTGSRWSRPCAFGLLRHFRLRDAGRPPSAMA